MTDLLIKLEAKDLLDDDVELTLGQLCSTCHLSAELVLELVDAGVVEPRGREPATWRFRALAVRRIHRALRLDRDLGVNLAGAALALDLLDEVERLRALVRRLES